MKPTFLMLIHDYRRITGHGSSEISYHWEKAKIAEYPMFLFDEWVYSTKSKDALFRWTDVVTKEND